MCHPACACTSIRDSAPPGGDTVVRWPARPLRPAAVPPRWLLAEHSADAAPQAPSEVGLWSCSSLPWQPSVLRSAPLEQGRALRKLRGAWLIVRVIRFRHTVLCLMVTTQVPKCYRDNARDPNPYYCWSITAPKADLAQPRLDTNQQAL